MLLDAKVKDEAELEAMLVNEPEQIEDGFLVLTHQRKTFGLKSLDILGVDSEDTLTLVELKVNADADQLRQAIQYYDWILQQGIDWISDAYKEKLGQRTITERMPQIFLIAPEFDTETIVEAKYLSEDIKVRFFQYLALKTGNKKHVKLIEVPIPAVKEIETKPWTMRDNAAYIANKNTRKLFTDFAKQIRQLDTKVEERPANWRVSYWIEGRKFCQLYPKREYFNVGFKTGGEEKWEVVGNIATAGSVKDAWAYIKEAFELMKKR